MFRSNWWFCIFIQLLTLPSLSRPFHASQLDPWQISHGYLHPLLQHFCSSLRPCLAANESTARRPYLAHLSTAQTISTPILPKFSSRTTSRTFGRLQLRRFPLPAEYDQRYNVSYIEVYRGKNARALSFCRLYELIGSYGLASKQTRSINGWGWKRRVTSKK